MIKDVAVCGLGVVGTPLYESIKDYFNVTLYDPPKGMDNDISNCGVVFISVPVDNRSGPDPTPDLSNVINIIKRTNEKAIIFIRSTVLPGTCDSLSENYKREIYSMPEFLTERRATADFNILPILCGGGDLILRLIFPKKVIVRVSNKEAELAKYAHNLLGTIKVHTCNIIYRQCQQLGLDYLNVRKGFLMSGLINAEHTLVPGPDNRLGFGGKCFPKDTQALANFMGWPDQDWLESMLDRNNVFRDSL